MKPVIKLTKTGHYDFDDQKIIGEDDQVPSGYTDILPCYEDGSGMYKPQLVNGKVVETATAEEMNPKPQLQEPTETEKLQAQLKASNDYMDFLEEVIVEMAQVVYQ